MYVYFFIYNKSSREWVWDGSEEITVWDIPHPSPATPQAV